MNIRKHIKITETGPDKDRDHGEVRASLRLHQIASVAREVWEESGCRALAKDHVTEELVQSLYGDLRNRAREIFGTVNQMLDEVPDGERRSEMRGKLTALFEPLMVAGENE